MTQHRILIAEDDELIVRLLEHKLTQRGIEVLTVDDGEEALRKAQEVSPDMLILDGMLPGMDGLEVLRRLKDDETLKHIPVMMLSARDMQADIVAALDLGADDYLVKPFMPEELWARVRKILRL